MNKRCGKLLVGACALGLWGSAAAQPISWQLGANIGDRSWDSPGYLKNNIDFHVASFSVSAGYKNLFASFLVEQSIGHEPIELAVDSSKLSQFSASTFPNSGAGNANRSEYSMVGGYNFNHGFSSFLGYVTSEVDISNLNQLIVSEASANSDGSQSTLLIFLDGAVKYRTHGPFTGVSYRVPVNDFGAFSFSVAYAYLTATGKVGSDPNYTLMHCVNRSCDGGSLSSGYFHRSITGRASGFSYGASWFGKFPGANEWARTMRYVVAAKLYKYDYNGAAIVPNQTNQDSKETYLVLTLGLTKTF